MISPTASDFLDVWEDYELHGSSEAKQRTDTVNQIKMEQLQGPIHTESKTLP